MNGDKKGKKANSQKYSSLKSPAERQDFMRTLSSKQRSQVMKLQTKTYDKGFKEVSGRTKTGGEKCGPSSVRVHKAGCKDVKNAKFKKGGNSNKGRGKTRTGTRTSD